MPFSMMHLMLIILHVESCIGIRWQVRVFPKTSFRWQSVLLCITKLNIFYDMFEWKHGGYERVAKSMHCLE